MRGWCSENGEVYRSTQESCNAMGGILFVAVEDAWEHREDEGPLQALSLEAHGRRRICQA